MEGGGEGMAWRACPKSECPKRLEFVLKVYLTPMMLGS